MGNKNNGNSFTPQRQQPGQNQLPRVGVILSDTREQAGEIIQDQDFDSVPLALFQENLLRKRVGQIQNGFGFVEQDLVVQIEHPLGRGG